MNDRLDNLPPLPGIYPDYPAPIIRSSPNGNEMVMARWGMPSPAFALKCRKADGGVTNIRNTTSPHRRCWLGQQNRCLVPFTRFSEIETLPDGKKKPAWFALGEDDPICFFAGIWTNWTSVRKVKDGETTDDLFGFLTTEPNREVASIHPQAMPVILRDEEAQTQWLTAPWPEAARLQVPLPDKSLIRLN